MKKTITLFYLLFAGLFSNAQIVKVTGFINDALSKQALPNATVSVKGKTNTNFKVAVTTNSKGQYSFPAPSKNLYQIEISYLGYTTLLKDSVALRDENQVIDTIYMKLAQKELATVTVAAKKPFITVSSDKITLNVAQSAIASGGNAYDVLKRAPGVNEQLDNLTFRGKSINVLINGRPSNLSGEELKNLLTNMQASTVEKIEILPNPSAKYDAQGGSVVNIVLAKNKAYGTNYVLTNGIGTGRFLSANTGIDVNNRNKNINVFGSVNYLHNKQYYETKSTRFLENGTITSDEYDVRNRNNYSFKGGVDYDVNKKSSVGFLVNGSFNYRNRAVNNNSILHYNTYIVDSTANVSTVGDAIFSNIYFNGYFKTKLDTAGKLLTLNLDYLNYNKKWDDDFTNRYLDEKGLQYLQPNFLRDNSPANLDVYSFTADYEKPTKKGAWEIGLKSTFTKTDNNVVWELNNGTGWVKDFGKTNHFIYKENVNAFYITKTSTIKKWELETGLRLEQTNTEGNSITNNLINKRNYFDFFPNINTSITNKANNSLNLSYRKSIQRFGFDYVNPFIIYENAYAFRQGNPDLVPQKNHEFSATYSIKNALFFGLSYVKAIKALGTSYKPSATTNISSYDNFNSSDYYYFFISYGSKLLSFWQSNITASSGLYKLNIPETSASKNTSGKPNPFLSVSVQNSFTFKKGYSAELNAAFQSGVTTGIFVSKGYFTMDAGFSKSFQKNKVVAKLSCSDIFNSLISIADINYLSFSQNRITKSESRFLNLSVKYRFGNKNVKRAIDKRSKIADIKNRIG